MEIELWDIGRVKPYENNPRKNDDSVDAVAASIREFGFRQPIVVDAEGVIIVGHTRYKAALKLGLEKVPVHVAKDLTADRARAYRIADNRVAEFSYWDVDLLPVEIESIRGLDDLDLGFLRIEGDVDFAVSKKPSKSEGKRKIVEHEFKYGVIIECLSESHQREILEMLSKIGDLKYRSIFW